MLTGLTLMVKSTFKILRIGGDINDFAVENLLVHEYVNIDNKEGNLLKPCCSIKMDSSEYSTDL